MHKVVHADQPLEPVDRAVDWLQLPHSRVGAVDRTVDREQGTVDRAVDRPESNLLSGLAQSTGRSTDRLNSQKFDRWPVDRPVDRKANSDLVSSQRAEFFMGYLYPIWGQFLSRIFEPKFFYSLVFLKASFQKSLLVLKIILYLFSRVGKIKEKYRFVIFALFFISIKY